MLAKLKMFKVNKYKISNLIRNRKVRMLDDNKFNERVLQRSKCGF